MANMISTEQILERAAQDGHFDINEWPRVLESVLQRLRDIVHNEFPIPTLPPPVSLPPTIDPEVVASTPPTVFSSDAELKDEEQLPDADDNAPPPNSQSSTKENDAPTDIAARPPPVPPFEVNHSSQHAVQPADSIESQDSPLPPDLLSLYTSSTRLLERDFAHSPPYTIQRLSELVLYPRKHYRFLPAYLRALDRIVSVSSPMSDFPLPTMHSTHTGGFLTNGDTQLNGIAERDGLGSDESLGGALLTPIPWLKNNTLASAAAAASQGSEGELHSESTETIDGPHGAGRIETVPVTVNGVPSATSVAHTSPAAQQPTSPTLSDQSDASSSSSSTEAQLREQGGITQGELLRQEQEAGVIPRTSPTARRSLFHSGAAAVGREVPLVGAPGSAPEMLEEEHPHARGPEEIGMEDMGPQHPSLTGGLDIEGAVGRGRSKSPQPEPVSDSIAEAIADAAEQDDSGQPGKDPKDVEKDVEMLKEAMDMEKVDEARDDDGDVIVADADGRPVDEKQKREVTGDLGGADAADATTL